MDTSFEPNQRGRPERNLKFGAYRCAQRTTVRLACMLFWTFSLIRQKTFHNFIYNYNILIYFVQMAHDYGEKIIYKFIHSPVKLVL